MIHDDSIQQPYKPATHPQAFLRVEVERLAKFVTLDLIEQVHKAYPELDIDTCNPQVYTILQRILTNGKTFADRILDVAADTLNLPTI